MAGSSDYFIKDPMSIPFHAPSFNSVEKHTLVGLRKVYTVLATEVLFSSCTSFQ